MENNKPSYEKLEKFFQEMQVIAGSTHFGKGSDLSIDNLPDILRSLMFTICGDPWASEADNLRKKLDKAAMKCTELHTFINHLINRHATHGILIGQSIEDAQASLRAMIKTGNWED